MKCRLFAALGTPTASVPSFTVFAVCLLLAASASAQPLHAAAPGRRDREPVPFARSRDDEAPIYRLSLRPSIGLGVGSHGYGGGAGVAVDYWLGETIGIGAHGALLGQTQILGERSEASTLALVGSLRSAPRGHYFFVALGAGYAKAMQTEGDGCLGLFGSCPEPTLMRYDGYTVTSALGVLAHPGRSWFEIGPVVRLDVIGDPEGRMPTDFLVSVNLTLGYGLLR